MKKILSIILLAFAIIFVGQFEMIKKANAEDVYMGQFNDYYNGGIYYYYVNPDEFKIYSFGFDVYVKVVVKTAGQTAQLYAVVMFQKSGENNWLVTEPSIQGIKRGQHWLDDKEYSNSFGKKVFNMVYPRYKQRLVQQEQAEAAQKEREKRLAEEKRSREEAERRRIKDENERKFYNLIAEGDKFYAAKDYENARNSYAKASEGAGNYSKLQDLGLKLLSNGRKLQKENNPAAAVDYFRKSHVMGYKYIDKFLHESLVEVGISDYTNKKFDDAIELLTEAINFKPNDKKFKRKYYKEYIYYNRGNIYFDLKDYDNAISDYKSAIGPAWTLLLYFDDYKKYYKSLWDAYSESKKFNEAIEYYSQFIKKNEITHNRNNGLAFYYLSKAYEEIGDKKNAKKAMKSYEKIAKKYKEYDMR